ATLPLYNFTFIPFILFTTVTLLGIHITKLKQTTGIEKKILKFHLIGLTILCASGLLDLIIAATIGMSKLPIDSFTILGTLSFGIMASWIFTEKFLVLLQDRQSAYDKLETAYTELEETSALKQIGESTAIINHEIKNYMSSISGLAELVGSRETLTGKGRERVRQIVDTARNLAKFSEDILSLSRMRVTKDKTLLNIEQVIQNCINNAFGAHKDSFTVESTEGGTMMHGDWGKLDHLFVNLFRNAVEAASDEALRIAVRFVKGRGVLVIVIEDNGVGCTEEQTKGLFKAFYTTKKGTRHGTGLGMSIARTIVESHGGRISAYSKNLQDTGEHGLRIEMAFPLYDEPEDTGSDTKDPVVLLKDGIEGLDAVIRVLQNVRMNPYVMQQADELATRPETGDSLCVLGNADNIARVSRFASRNNRLFVLSHHKGSLYALRAGANELPAHFSEEFVLSRLVESHPQ
ncbi:MAG: GHKL domain-containing protein, partial [Chitinivibrionales bacterium]|nr:GHKL domain-containing protein [Chitinivibrionales bacterium]MBD3396779.1 GHKL domain-containing protein [Chitinivibrionales bacterium]